MPLSGWVMFGYFWAVILAGVALSIVGWRKRAQDDAEEQRYGVVREVPPQPWPGPGPSEEERRAR
jgi:hypothetical protein